MGYVMEVIEFHVFCVSLWNMMVHYTCKQVTSSQPAYYRPAEGGEMACNSCTSCIEGEMLAVTKSKSHNDVV